MLGHDWSFVEKRGGEKRFRAQRQPKNNRFDFSKVSSAGILSGKPLILGAERGLSTGLW
jgi:hypothetical protein